MPKVEISDDVKYRQLAEDSAKLEDDCRFNNHEENHFANAYTWILLISFVISGVFMPLLIVAITENGGAEPTTLLVALPSSIGMCLGRLINPVEKENGVVHWNLVILIALLETISQAIILDGLMLAGSAIYTVAYSSVLIYTAIFSYYFVHRSLNHRQWIGILTVMFGLAIASLGAKADGKDVLIGFILVLIGSLTHSLTYVGSEYLLTLSEEPIRPEYLSFLLGSIGTSINLCWQCVYTFPRAQTLILDNITSHQGSVHIILACYVFLLICACIHSFCFYYLLCRVGSITTGLCKGAQSVLVFVASHFAFCSVEKAQCFTVPKGISLITVVIGVVVYSVFTNERAHHYEQIMNHNEAEDIEQELETLKYQTG